MKLKFVIISSLLFPTLVFSGFNVIRQTPNSLIIEYRMDQLNQSRIQIDSQEFLSLAISDGILTGEYGKPAVPYIHGRLAVPPGARISYQISALESETVNDVTVLPQGLEPPPEHDVRPRLPRCQAMPLN